jgi:hypothetical protein
MLPAPKDSTPGQTDPEMLPVPGESEITAPDRAYLFQPYFRTSRYDVWQYYAVDRFGHFRPRVIYSPYGSFYLYNGEPYPWVSNHPLEFMPYVSD